MKEQNTMLRYLNDFQVSEITGLAVSTLRNDRWLRRGIPYIKKGRAVRYDIKDVMDFMESKKIIVDQ